MSKPTVARATPNPATPPVTLADVTITWKEGDQEKVATGQQLARLLTVASRRSPSGLFASLREGDKAGFMLRGLANLVFPDPRDPDEFSEDVRAFLCFTMEDLAAEVEADAVYSEDQPYGFTLTIAKDSGLRPHGYETPAAVRKVVNAGVARLKAQGRA